MAGVQLEQQGWLRWDRGIMGWLIVGQNQKRLSHPKSLDAQTEVNECTAELHDGASLRAKTSQLVASEAPAFASCPSGSWQFKSSKDVPGEAV